MTYISPAEEKRAWEASRMSLEEFEVKLKEFIIKECGLDIRKDNELLTYSVKSWNIHQFIIQIDSDDLEDL